MARTNGMGTRLDEVIGVARRGFVSIALACLALALLDAAVTQRVSALMAEAETLDQMLQLAGSTRLWGPLALASVPWLYLNLVMILRLYATAEGLVPGGLGDWRAALVALPGAILAAILYSVASTLGTLAFVVPGVYISVAWILWPVTCSVERCGGIACLPRSTALVTGHWLPTAGLVTLATILAWLGGMLAEMVASLLPLLAGGEGTLATGLSAAIRIGAGALLAPLFPAALVVAYRACRARQPGSSTT